MNDTFKKVYKESRIKDRRDITFQLAYNDKSIVLQRLNHIWGGDAKYETIKSYPFTMNVDEIIEDVKEMIAKYETITGSHMYGCISKRQSKVKE